MTKKVLVLAVVALGLMVTGCGAANTSEQAAEPTVVAIAASVEDVTGLWEGIDGGSGAIRIEENGTWTFDSLDDEVGIIGGGDVWFEGLHIFISEADWNSPGEEKCDGAGIYEVHLLSDGDIRFIVVKDDCERRVTYLQGDTSMAITVKWRPLS